MGIADSGQLPVCGTVFISDKERLSEVCVRGLDARVLLAQARVMALLDTQAAEDMCFEVAFQAQLQGIDDTKEGIDQPPLMFAGEEWHLLRPWRWGRVFELERVCMCNCAGCRDGAGNPCQVHG